MDTYASKRFGGAKPVDPAVWSHLSAYTWPGNFRELKNITEYVYISSQDCDVITLEHFPKYILEEIFTKPELLRLFEEEPLILEVLHLFSQAHPASVGRNSLLQMAQRQIALSEGTAKRILAVLEREGLIRVGTTKQGSAITPLGLHTHNIAYGQAPGSAGFPGDTGRA
jgi:transcriptional regulator of acetoin/glycerol metabolism